MFPARWTFVASTILTPEVIPGSAGLTRLYTSSQVVSQLLQCRHTTKRIHVPSKAETEFELSFRMLSRHV